MFIRALFFVTTITISQQTVAAFVDVTFDVLLNNRHNATIGPGIPSANPVPAGTYIQWDRDRSYSGEQFQFTLRLDSADLSINAVNGNSAEYSSSAMYNSSLAAQDANKYTPSIPTRRDERFTFNSESNESLHMYNGSIGYVNSREGDALITEEHKNLAYLGHTWYDVMRDEADYINDQDDLVAFLNEVMLEDTYFSYWHLATNSERMQEDYYSTGSTRSIYTSLEGVRYQGYANIASITTVPLPSAVWLFASGLMGFISFKRFGNLYRRLL